jgi:hypothetical protein
MRTVKLSAFLSGLCGVAVALGLLAVSAHADVTTERGASILAFPKVLANGDADTLIQIANTSNSMVHARCFYVNAAPNPFTGAPLWQVTDFSIWLTKQQPTHWQVSTGRFVDPTDQCIVSGHIEPWLCANAGIDPGAVPPVPDNFEGELKCVEVDVSDSPIGGNHLKGEATIKIGEDVSKYNAIGFEGTDLVGQTGNQLRLDQPLGVQDPVGQYNACPDQLLLNHITEGSTDPVILAAGMGGLCSIGSAPCEEDADCGDAGGTCENGPRILDGTGNLALRSATLTDLTLVPCTQDFENSIPSSVTVQFRVYNEFEQLLTTSTTVDCWSDFFLYEVTSPNNPENSQFSRGIVGTTYAQTRIIPNKDGGAVIGVAGVLRADSASRVTRSALNLHMVGDHLTGTDGAIVDMITLPEH